MGENWRQGVVDEDLKKAQVDNNPLSDREIIESIEQKVCQLYIGIENILSLIENPILRIDEDGKIERIQAHG